MIERPLAFLFLLVFPAILAASCSSPRLDPPAARNESLDEGKRLELPVEGFFPRLGLQWNYAAAIEGFGPDAAAPPRVAFRITARDEAGHPWAGWWLGGEGRPLEFTGVTLEPEEVYFRPPRLFPFQGDEPLKALARAPWPVATPGVPGTRRHRVILDEFWEPAADRREVIKEYRNIGFEPVEAPAGRFEKAWRVDGTSPGWTGRFWWVDRVGWVRMVFTADDNRKVEMSLLEVREIPPGG